MALFPPIIPSPQKNSGRIPPSAASPPQAERSALGKTERGQLCSWQLSGTYCAEYAAATSTIAVAAAAAAGAAAARVHRCLVYDHTVHSLHTTGH